MHHNPLDIRRLDSGITDNQLGGVIPAGGFYFKGGVHLEERVGGLEAVGWGRERDRLAGEGLEGVLIG